MVPGMLSGNQEEFQLMWRDLEINNVPYNQTSEKDDKFYSFYTVHTLANVARSKSRMNNKRDDHCNIWKMGGQVAYIR